MTLECHDIGDRLAALYESVSRTAQEAAGVSGHSAGAADIHTLRDIEVRVGQQAVLLARAQ